MTQLFPRLTPQVAYEAAARNEAMSIDDLRRQPVSLDGASYAATGGRRVALSELQQLRAEMENLPSASDSRSSTTSLRQQFDRELLALLGAKGFPTGEMSRPDVWAWLAIRLVPHLARWRFGGAEDRVSLERLAGSVYRNVLGRLWFRALVFDLGADTSDRWSLAHSLTEDAAVALLERPTISSEPRLARSIAAEWVRHRNAGVSDPEGLMRGVAKRVMLLAAAVDTSVVDAEALNAYVSKLFGQEIATRSTSLDVETERESRAANG